MISVCIPTYNGEKYIRQQLDSILAQLNEGDEVIISDDSSTDSTVEIINGYGDNRIRLIEGCTFRSPIYNLENALKYAKGDYIFLADQDDIWLPEKVSLSLKYLQDFDAVLSDCKIVNSDLVTIHESMFEFYGAKLGLFSNLTKNAYAGCCMAVKKSVLKCAMPFPKRIPMHDVWMGFVIELLYKPCLIHEKLILHRIHQSNASSTGFKSSYSFLKKISFRWNLLRNIPLLLYRKISN
ncbi:MAG: glycosyltransferase family 2 protein [Bacteroidales bacterium]|nr:glycosyltransferase family 2 protein [Bacteroidales bacterium]